MKVLIDMNLSPLWVQFFIDAGIEAVHWSTIGDRQCESQLEAGALITIDQARLRVRILPIRTD